MTHNKLHFAKRASASVTHTYSVPDFSQFKWPNSIGTIHRRPRVYTRASRISTWSSCASHLSVQTSATVTRHQADTVASVFAQKCSSAMLVRQRIEQRFPRKRSQSSRGAKHSRPEMSWPVLICTCVRSRLQIWFSDRMSIEWVSLFAHRPTLDYVHIHWFGSTTTSITYTFYGEINYIWGIADTVLIPRLKYGTMYDI